MSECIAMFATAQFLIYLVKHTSEHIVLVIIMLSNISLWTCQQTYRAFRRWNMSTDILLAFEHVNRHDTFVLRTCQSNITCSKHANQHIVFLICHVDNFHRNNRSDLDVLSADFCDNVAVLKYLQSLALSVLVIFVENS